MMCYPNQLKDDYRIAKVLEVYPDEKDLVRTVRVGYRRRNKREQADTYWKKPLVEEVVAIQRLSILQAASESLPTGTELDDLPLDHSEREKQVKAGYVKLNALEGIRLFM